MDTIVNHITEIAHCFEPPFMDQNEVKAINICLELFNKPINALEWGSGKSTLFFSSLLQQGSSWLALEHDLSWFQEVKTKIEMHPSSCASVIHIQPDRPFDGLTDGDFATFRNYVLSPARTGNTFDFILVDGRARVECLAVGWELLKESGVMVLHDAQRETYSSGVPKDCLSIRLINPNVWVEGPVSTLFMVKQQEVAKRLAESLVDGLDNGAQLEMVNIAGYKKAVPTHNLSSAGMDLSAWDFLSRCKQIKFYAGDMPEMEQYDGWIGLSITKNDHHHILHDVTYSFPIADNSVDAFQAEDVLEHIQYEKLPDILDEIFRVLKPSGLFRLSIPDYGCDVLRERSVKDESGNIVFDPGGGGTPDYPGHVWFPRIDSIKALLDRTNFAKEGQIEYLHYWNMDNATFVTKPIDYAKGHVCRTPDYDPRVKNPYRPLSIVVDMTKSAPQPAQKPLHYNDDYFNWQKDIGAFGGLVNLFKFRKFIKATDTVVDFGCGGGYLLKNIGGLLKIGIEVNPIARHNAAQRGISVYEDASELDDNCADVIISNHALEHVFAPLDALKQLYRKLKPGGRIVFVVPHQDTREAFNPQDINQHLYTWNQQTLGNLFKIASFDVQLVEAIQHQWPDNYAEVYEKFGEQEFHRICHENAVENNNFQIRIVAVKQASL